MPHYYRYRFCAAQNPQSSFTDARQFSRFRSICEDPCLHANPGRLLILASPKSVINDGDETLSGRCCTSAPNWLSLQPCISAHVFQPVYFSACISAHVFQRMYFSACISAHVFQRMYFSACISAHVFQRMYFSACISARVFQPVYFSACISARVFQRKYCSVHRHAQAHKWN